MEHFYFIQFPEQFFHLKQSVNDAVPVIPFFDDLSVFNRLASSLKRWGRSVSVFYEEAAYPLDQFLAQVKLFDSVFTFDPNAAKLVRGAGFGGKIYLFSSFRMLADAGFFKKYSIDPVVCGKSNYELAKSSGLEPVYYVTDKACIAEFGLCISRRSTPQIPFGCDCRCREKSLAKAGVEFPVSMKPELVTPEDCSWFLFSEKTVYPAVHSAEEPRSQSLERCWNYRYPLGVEILKPGKTTDKRVYTFAADRSTPHLIEKELIGFYGYSGSIYRGVWLDPSCAKILKYDENRVNVEISGTYQTILMIRRYTEEEKNLLKSARHFIYTLPEQRFIEPRMEVTKTEAKPRTGRRYSDRVRISVISDDPRRFAVFKSRNVERRILIYDRKVPADFSDFLLIPGILNPKDVEELSKLEKIKGFVVFDQISLDTFSELFPGKTILLHPLATVDPEESPTYLSASTTVFVSRYRSEKRSDYSWSDINIFLENKTGFSEFVSHKKMIRNGKKRELWVNIAGVTESAVKFLKAQADTMILGMK